MFRKILCFIGLHEWTWSSSDFKDELGNPDWNSYWYNYKYHKHPPSFAKCKFCGERYSD